MNNKKIHILPYIDYDDHFIIDIEKILPPKLLINNNYSNDDVLNRI